MTELPEDLWRLHDARSDRHRHPGCLLPWYSEAKYAEARSRSCDPEWLPESDLRLPRYRALKEMAIFAVRERWTRKVQPEPAKPELPAPDPRAHWSAHLIHGLLTKTERELRNKPLGEIANGKKVPARVDQEVLEMVVKTTTASPRSINRTRMVLMSEGSTARAVAEFQSREQKSAPIDPTIARYLGRYEPPPYLAGARERARMMVEYYRNRQTFGYQPLAAA